MTDTSTEAVEGPQKDTRNIVDVLLETLVGADRVIIETRNALDLMDAHYLHAPTLLRALAAERDALKEQLAEPQKPKGKIWRGVKGYLTPQYFELANAMEEAVAQERERCAAIADRQAWAHGGVHFNAPEMNSAAIAAAIRKGKT